MGSSRGLGALRGAVAESLGTVPIFHFSFLISRILFRRQTLHTRSGERQLGRRLQGLCLGGPVTVEGCEFGPSSHALRASRAPLGSRCLERSHCGLLRFVYNMLVELLAK